MVNFDNVMGENSPKWPRIPENLYNMLIFGRSGSQKINALLYQTSHQPDIDNVYI